LETNRVLSIRWGLDIGEKVSAITGLIVDSLIDWRR
jgi:hypothetical protein